MLPRRIAPCTSFEIIRRTSLEEAKTRVLANTVGILWIPIDTEQSRLDGEAHVDVLPREENGKVMKTRLRAERMEPATAGRQGES